MADFLNTLAAVLTYPDESYVERVDACLRAAPEYVRGHISAFASHVSGLNTEEAQELFTRTLDLNPVCSLELGWHLFGENYDRGLLMARLRRELAAHGIEENGELPDHLTHALPLLAAMPKVQAQEFAGAIIVPALEKMLAAFAGKQNCYESLLLALAETLEEQHPGIHQAVASQQPLPILPPTETNQSTAGRTHA